MAIATLINRTCQIHRRTASGSVDDYGNEIQLDTTVDTVCEIQQRARAEGDLEGETSDEGWAGYFLPTEALAAGDAIVVDGETYEIVGDPWRARNPRTGLEHHIEATLRRTAGPEDSS